MLPATMRCAGSRGTPAYIELHPVVASAAPVEAVVCRLEDVSFAYRSGPPVLERAGLELRRGEVVAPHRPERERRDDARQARRRAPPACCVRRRRLRGRASYLAGSGALSRPRPGGRKVALGVGGDLSRAANALASVGLAGFEARHPRDLSSGERERLALASVLVTNPDLLILDEPTRGVDPERKEELASLLRTRARGRATLVVTHDLVFAAGVADRVVPLGVEEDSFMPSPRVVALGAAAAAFAAGAWTAVDPGHAALSLLLVACALIVGAASWLETGPPRLPWAAWGQSQATAAPSPPLPARPRRSLH